MQHYLSEVARVLEPDGRCLITYYLVDDGAIRAIASGKSLFPFRATADGYYAVEGRTPEYAIGHPLRTVRRLYEAQGLCIEEPVRHGAWSGRDGYWSFQDIVVARKPPTEEADVNRVASSRRRGAETTAGSLRPAGS